MPKPEDSHVSDVEAVSLDVPDCGGPEAVTVVSARLVDSGLPDAVTVTSR